MHLASINLYPVKSLRGVSVAEAAVDALGLCHDRRFLIVEPTGKAVTQRADPVLATIHTSLGRDCLELSTDTQGELRVGLATDPSAPRQPCEVWRATGMLAEDCGEEAAGWLSKIVGRPVRLVRIGDDFCRPIPVRKMPTTLNHVTNAPLSAPGYRDTQGSDLPTDHRVSFADAHPFLALGEASMFELNRRLTGKGQGQLPTDRFRANLLLAGGAPHEEDTLGRFQLGSLILHAAGPCVRCIMTTTDQASGERGVEPLRTLAEYRRNPDCRTELLFGQNLIHETKSGILKVGDVVQKL